MFSFLQSKQPSITSNFNLNNIGMKYLQQNLDERKLQLQEFLAQLLNNIQNDNILGTMQNNPISQQFRQQRVEEIIEQYLYNEQEKQIQSLSQINAFLKQELQLLEEKLEQKQNEFNDEIEYKCLQLNQYKQNQKSLEDQLQYSQSELEIQKATNSQLQIQKDSQMKVVGREIEKELAQYKLDLENKFKIISQQNNDLLKKDSHIAEMELQVSSMKKRIDLLEQNLEYQLNHDFKQVSQIEMLQYNCKQLEQQCANYDQAKKEVEIENSVLKNHNQQLLTEMEEIKFQLNDTLKKFENQSQLSLKKLESEQQQFEKTKKNKKQKYKGKLLQIQQENKILKNKYQDSYQVQQQMEEQLEKTSQELQKTIERTQKDLERVKQSWESKITIIENDYQQYIKQLIQSHQSELNVLVKQNQNEYYQHIANIQNSKEMETLLNKNENQQIQFKLDSLTTNYISIKEHEQIVNEKITQFQISNQQHLLELKQKAEEQIKEQIEKECQKSDYEKNSLVSQYTNELEQYKKVMQEVQQIKDKYEDKIEEQQQLIMKMEDVIKEEKLEKQLLQNKNKYLDGNNQNNINQLNSLQQNINDKTQIINQFEISKERYENTMIELKNELKSNLTKIQQLDKSHKEAESNLCKQKSEIISLNNQIREQKEALTRQEIKNQDDQLKLEQCQNEANSKIEKNIVLINDLQMETKSLKNELQDQILENNKLKEHIVQFTIENQKVEQIIEQLENELQSNLQVKEQLSEQLQKCKQEQKLMEDKIQAQQLNIQNSKRKLSQKVIQINKQIKALFLTYKRDFSLFMNQTKNNFNNQFMLQYSLLQKALQKMNQTYGNQKQSNFIKCSQIIEQYQSKLEKKINQMNGNFEMQLNEQKEIEKTQSFEMNEVLKEYEKIKKDMENLISIYEKQQQNIENLKREKQIALQEKNEAIDLLQTQKAQFDLEKEKITNEAISSIESIQKEQIAKSKKQKKEIKELKIQQEQILSQFNSKVQTMQEEWQQQIENIDKYLQSELKDKNEIIKQLKYDQEIYEEKITHLQKLCKDILEDKQYNVEQFQYKISRFQDELKLEGERLTQLKSENKQKTDKLKNKKKSLLNELQIKNQKLAQLQQQNQQNKLEIESLIKINQSNNSNLDEMSFHQIQEQISNLRMTKLNQIQQNQKFLEVRNKNHQQVQKLIKKRVSESDTRLDQIKNLQIQQKQLQTKGPMPFSEKIPKQPIMAGKDFISPIVSNNQQLMKFQHSKGISQDFWLNKFQ